MKLFSFKRRPHTLKLSALGAGLVASLTACPGPMPPMPYNSVTLSFTFPAISRVEAQNLMLAAYYYDGSETPKILQQTPLGYAGSGADAITSAQLQLYQLAAAQASTCTSPFVGGETQDRTQVSVTPSTVNTCNVYFSIYTDTGSHIPTTSTEKYMTNDLMSYASSDFTYSFVSPDGNSSESGLRKQGWTLIRHLVLQPSSTPGKYLVRMNSVPAADQALPIRMHEPTNGLISQSLGSSSRSRK